MADFFIQNEGSIFLMRPLNEAAKGWLEDMLSGDVQYFGDAAVVEHRFIAAIVRGAQDDGFTVE